MQENVTLCKLDVVGLYPNISHKGGSAAMWKTLDA